MPHPLEKEIRVVCRRARRLAALQAIAWFAVCVLSAALLAGLGDYVFRIRDPGVRFLGASAVLGVLAWSCYRFLAPVLAFHVTELQAAQHVEQCFPQLEGRLSSSIEFLKQAESDATAGSAALRRAVVADTSARMDEVDGTACLDPKYAYRALAAALAAGLAIGAVCLLDGPSAGLAARRLLAPWIDAPWPRRNELVFEEPPTRLARGDDFAVQLIDAKGHLPPVVDFQYRLSGDHRILVRRMSRSGQKMTHRVENVIRPFQYRAVGGDDDAMPWIQLEVDEPARVVSLQVRLHPPAYTGWPVEAAEPVFTALAGTRVEIRGRSTKPLAAARLVRETPQGRVETPLRRSADGREFFLPSRGDDAWILRQSGAYWFELTDRTGLVGGRPARWAASAAADAPPAVAIVNPPDRALATVNAVAMLRTIVKDDLAIQRVQLRYRHSDQVGQPEQSIELYHGPEPARPAVASGLADALGESRTLTYSWDLRSLPGLKPGHWIEYRVAATDYKLQTGESKIQRWIVVSTEELEDRIAQQQADLLDQLAEVLERQKTARSQVVSLEIQLDQVGRLTQSDIDQLESAGLNQRAVADALTQEGAGVESRIAGVLEDLERNRLDRPEIARRMGQLLQQLRKISRGDLPIIQQEMTSALKIAQERGDRRTGPSRGDAPAGTKTASQDASAVDSLREAGRRQDSVIQQLEQLLAELTQWDNYRRIAREISRLRRDQQAIYQRADRLRLETLSRQLNDLTAQQTADLRRLAQRQNELARGFARIQSRMEQMRDRLRDGEPLASETIADSLDAAQRTAVGARMRESGLRLERNQIGNSLTDQEAVLQGLQEMLDTLADRRKADLARIVRTLLDDDAELAELRRRLSVVEKELRETASVQDAAQRRRRLTGLGDRQADLAEAIRTLARRLNRSEAADSASIANEAAEYLDQARRAGGQDDVPGGLNETKQAERRLEDAQQALADAIQRAERRRRDQQLAGLKDAIAALDASQKSLHDDTVRLETLRASQPVPPPRSQMARVGQLSEQQRALAADSGRLANGLDAQPAFQFVLQDAAKEMARAAVSLARRETGQPTQRPQQLALAQLQRLLLALKSNSGEPNSSAESADDTGQTPGGDNAARLVELILLRSLQSGIGDRTANLLEEKRRGVEWTGQEILDLTQLTQQQGALADVVLRSAHAPAAAPGEDSSDLSPPPQRPNESEKSSTEEQPAGEETQRDPTDRPLASIGLEMRQAQQHMAQEDESGETERLHLRILADLDQLIQQVSRANSTGQPAAGRRDTERPGGPADRSPGDRPDNDPSRASPGGASGNEAASGGAARTRELFEKIWGHLPPQVRQQLTNPSREQFLPKYERLIEQYYSRLSEDEPARP